MAVRIILRKMVFRSFQALQRSPKLSGVAPTHTLFMKLLPFAASGEAFCVENRHIQGGLQQAIQMRYLLQRAGQC